MKIALLVLLVILVVALAVHLALAWGFSAKAHRMAGQLLETASAAGVTLPPEVRAVAEAGLAEPEGVRAVRIAQDAEFKAAGRTDFAPMPAVQTIGVGQSGFVWWAHQPGPVGPMVRVIDAFVGGEGLLEARLFGSVPVAKAEGALASRGEAMRYLAELPWAPDALAGNGAIEWTVLEDGWIEAALVVAGERVAVRLRVQGNDFVEMRAEGRPEEKPDGTIVLHTWQGHFSEHAEIGGRRIPLRGEVGYVDDGIYDPYWRGRITSYQILR